LDVSADDGIGNRGPWSQRRAAAVEVFVPLGGRAMYGLLGGTLFSDPKGRKVVWAVSGNPNQIVAGTLLGADADVRPGVGISEFQEAVCTVAERTASERQLTGDVVIDLAAYSDLYSTRSIFAWLSGTVVTLLALPSLPDSEKEVVHALGLRLSSAAIFSPERL
jgi:hypothetical protein